MGDAWLLPYQSGALVGEVSLLRHRHDLGQRNPRQKPVTILEVLDQGWPGAWRPPPAAPKPSTWSDSTDTHTLPDTLPPGNVSPVSSSESGITPQ